LMLGESGQATVAESQASEVQSSAKAKSAEQEVPENSESESSLEAVEGLAKWL